jgi:hypothetical protein
MKPLDVLVEHGANAQQVGAKLRTVPGPVGATAPPTARRRRDPGAPNGPGDRNV